MAPTNIDATITLAKFEDNWISGLYESVFWLSAGNAGTRVLVTRSPSKRRETLLITDLTAVQPTILNVGSAILSGDYTTTSATDVALGNSTGVTLTTKGSGIFLVQLISSVSNSVATDGMIIGVYRVAGSSSPSQGSGCSGTIIENGVFISPANGQKGMIPVIYLDNQTTPGNPGSGVITGTNTWYISMKIVTGGTGTVYGDNGQPTILIVREL